MQCLNKQKFSDDIAIMIVFYKFVYCAEFFFKARKDHGTAVAWNTVYQEAGASFLSEELERVIVQLKRITQE
ncbi:MAG: hypothetical protein PUP92_35065 [Rhizonema sp. PD38]|nr:hypothetical protein [Rhizonema sp. PD38]